MKKEPEIKLKNDTHMILILTDEQKNPLTKILSIYIFTKTYIYKNVYLKYTEYLNMSQTCNY